MVSQPPKDTPFGLEPNVAAGLAYLLGILGGIIMLAGGGTNKFVKWAAAQSIVLWVAFLILYIILGFITVPMLMAGLWTVHSLLYWIVELASLGAWIWTTITGFQGKEVRVPIIANLTESMFKSML